MNSILGSGSNIKVNNVSLEQTERKNKETGEIEIYYDYVENGNATNSKSDQFIQDVGGKNLASSEVEATLYSADALKTADTISKEQRSSLFFALFMEVHLWVQLLFAFGGTDEREGSYGPEYGRKSAPGADSQWARVPGGCDQAAGGTGLRQGQRLCPAGAGG